jgi:hypothetical protein
MMGKQLSPDPVARTADLDCYVSMSALNGYRRLRLLTPSLRVNFKDLGLCVLGRLCWRRVCAIASAERLTTKHSSRSSSHPTFFSS